MSQFDFPRIHIKGQFYYNPGTANNDSIDPTESGPTTANTETVQPVSNCLNDDEFKKWLTSINPGLGILNGQWNVYGDMSFWFDNVKVTAVQSSYDKISTCNKAFPLIGSLVTIDKAFAIDVNPEGFSTTQVFCDSISFKGTDGAVGEKNCWTSPKPSRGATRWINWYRNLSYHGIAGSSGAAGGVSATWQMAIPIEKAKYKNSTQEESIPNTLLGNLGKIYYNDFPEKNAFGKRRKGMIFRMNVYLCSPLISDNDLFNSYFSKGIQKENPAMGKIVGTFAPWFEDEMESITLSRFLNSNCSFSNPYSKQSFPKNQAYLAPVLASVNKKENIVSLDLSNTFPEDGPEGNKFFMGSATLQIKTPEATLIPIGKFNYDKENYELFGGLVDIKFDPAKGDEIERGLLAISLENFKQGPLLLENEFMLATDSSCVYLNENNFKNNEITIRACYKGGSIKQPLRIDIDQWKMTPTYELNNIPKLLNRSSHQIPQTGELEYKLEPIDGPGVRIFRFVLPSLSSNDLNIITDFMCSVRVLPKNNYDWVKYEDLNFDLIYREILRYYNLLLPAMNKFMPMDDPTVWNSPIVAHYVINKTKEDQWDKFHYMPRTRDLSDSRMCLLHRFCNKILSEYENAAKSL
jgi:hypothetical protein